MAEFKVIYSSWSDVSIKIIYTKSISEDNQEELENENETNKKTNGIMKKYWIKKLNERQVIHAPTEEIANKLCSKFHELGLQWRSRKSYSRHLRWDMHMEETCYSPSNGSFGDLDYFTQQNYEILTIDQLLDFQANEYPKVMEVSANNHNWCKRVVFMEKNGRFLAWFNAESLKEAERESNVCVWSYAREVKPTLELTIGQIAEKFNVSPEQIKIKK